jgi:CBS domain-containing protein
MIGTKKPLWQQTAADLMSREVLALPRPMSLRAAANRLARANVSGAPVVDEEGRCVGVLSTTDLARWIDQGAAAAKRSFAPTDFWADWEVVDFEALPADDVGRYMSTHLVTAAPEATVGELARAMLAAHIHRVIVLDRDGKPVGIVSSTDILAAVAAEDQVERPPEGW